MPDITAEVFINNDRRLTLDLELPPDCPTGPATVTLNLTPKVISPERAKNKMDELRGKYRGQIWMAEDFDAPLEDFAEHM
jgi:hypothetical protein